MQPRVRLTGLTLNSGDRIQLPEAGVTCIVGSNNVGKSRLLRDIDGMLEDEHYQSVVVAELELHKDPIDSASGLAFLESSASRLNQPPGQPPSFQPILGGTQIRGSDFPAFYGQPDIPRLGPTKRFFVWCASAGSLLGAASGSAGHVGMDSSIGHPLIRMFRDGAIEAELSSLSETNFGSPLTLDRVNADVRLRLGRPDLEAPPIDRPSLAYADAVRALPTLEEQGDGLKSFMGLALTAMTGSCQVLLVDEPESFLHPSQARALGRWLAREATRRDIQIVISTHDRDLLLGLVDAGETGVVNLVRVTRHGDANAAISLSDEEVAAAWRDPVLRYSNLLQGLFHAKVAICESDADCRFYGAVLDQMGNEKNMQAMANDLLFVPSGGKQRVASMATALTRLGVETVAMVDFDVLRDRAIIRGILEAVGGHWTESMGADYIVMATAVNQKQRWDEVKHGGVSSLPAGAPTEAGRRLVVELATANVLVVPVGEMEDFERGLDVHGGAWVSQMLEDSRHRTCEEARRYVAPLLNLAWPAAPLA